MNGYGAQLARKISLNVGKTAADLFSDVYARKMDIVNRGLSGYNTEWAIPVFKQVIEVPSNAKTG